MPSIARFTGIVKDGKFRPDEPGRYAGRLASLEGRRIRVSLDREARHRTLSQNAYYWGVVVEALSEWSGHEPGEIHEAMKAMFLEPTELKVGNEVVEVPASTRTLSMEDFSEFVSKVMRFASEQGLYIPSAEEM